MGRVFGALGLGLLGVATVTSCFVDPYLTQGDAGTLPDVSTPDVSTGDATSDGLPTIDAPTCGNGGVCVEAVPAGWTGPLAVFDKSGGPPAPTAPACPSTYPTDVFDGTASLSAPAATCGCTCGSSGGTCGSPTVAIYTGTNCGTTSCYSGQFTACTTMTCNTGNSAKVTPPTPTGVTCTSNPSKTVPQLAWGRTGRACQTTNITAGCSGTNICVPLPATPYASTVCILQAGDVACPSGSTYSQKFTYYSGASDNRDCSTCNCAVQNASCTGGAVTIWDASGCSSGSTIVIASDGQCHPTNGVTTVAAKQTTAATPSSTSCGATQGSGQATGSATPTGATTVCCAP